MSEQGRSIRTIARVLRLSRRTVRKYLEPVAGPTGGDGGREEKVDWEHVRQEVDLVFVVNPIPKERWKSCSQSAVFNRNYRSW